MIEIVHRHDKTKVLYRSENAQDVRQAVLEAIGAKANLRYADLGSANLWSANLRSADLRSADLGYADLRYANLRSADLRYANLGSADLRYANLRSADLGYANLGYADLRYANLGYADLGSANLWYAKGAPLVVYGLPSGEALIHLANDVWMIQVGCWEGTLDELEEMIAKDDGWPESTGEQVTLRRPGLEALVGLARAHIGYVEATTSDDETEDEAPVKEAA